MGKRGPKPSDSKNLEINKEVVRCANRAQHNIQWLKACDRIRHFMNISRRTWANAMLYLVELGLGIVEKEEKLYNERIRPDSKGN